MLSLVLSVFSSCFSGGLIVFGVVAVFDGSILVVVPNRE